MLILINVMTKPGIITKIDLCAFTYGHVLSQKQKKKLKNSSTKYRV